MERCRTCLQVVINRSQYFSLGDNEQDCFVAAIKSKLESCVPELTLNIIRNPIMCIDCVNTLCDAYNFKKKCLQIEESIYQCILKKNVEDNTVDINLVFKWCEENIRKNQNDTAHPNRRLTKNNKATSQKNSQSQIDHVCSEKEEDDFCCEILNEIIHTADMVNNSKNSLDPNMQAFKKSVKDAINNSHIQDKSHEEQDQSDTIFEISDSSDECDSVQIVSAEDETSNTNVIPNEIPTTAEKIRSPIKTNTVPDFQGSYVPKVNDKKKEECEKHKERSKHSSYGRNLKPNGKLYEDNINLQYKRKRQKRRKKPQMIQKNSKQFKAMDDNNIADKSIDLNLEANAESENINASVTPVIIDWDTNEDCMNTTEMDIKTEDIDIKEELLCIPKDQEVKETNSKTQNVVHLSETEAVHSSENETNMLDLNNEPQNVNIIAGMSCYLEDFSAFENRYSEYARTISCSEQVDVPESSFALKDTSQRINEYSNEDEHFVYKGYRLRQNKMTNSNDKNKTNKRYTKTYLKQTKYKCNTCKFTTTNRSLIIEHRRKQNEISNTDNPYICESCNVKTSGVFLKHMFSHGQQKCKFCDFKDLNVEILYKHMSENHPSLGKCILCNCTGLDKNLTDSKAKSYTCSVCHTEYSTRWHVCVASSNESNAVEHAYAMLPL